MKCIITLPCYNEEKNLQQLIPLIDKTLHETLPYHIVAVDDGSTDRTQEILCKLSQQYPMTIINHQKNRGLASALETGLKEALRSVQKDDDLIITMDADNTHNPKYILNLVAATKQCDIVVSSRYIKGGKQLGVPLFRRVLSKTVNNLIRIITKIPVEDATSGFRCYRASALKRTIKTFDKLIQSKGFEVSFEILFKTYWCTKKIKEVPNTLDYGRKIGKSKVKLITTVFRYVLLLSKLCAWRIQGALKSENRNSLQPSQRGWWSRKNSQKTSKPSSQVGT